MFHKNIKKVIKYPFTIFEIADFLSNDLYNLIDENFPLTSDNMFNTYYQSVDNGKYYFTSEDEVYSEISSNYPCMKELEKIVYSPEFFCFFYNSLYFSFLQSAEVKQFVKLLRIPKMAKSRQIINLRNFYYNEIQTRIEYSYMPNGSSLRPHTDNRNKLLSLMLYFPQKLNDGYFQKNLGTQFWVNKTPNRKNKHYNNVIEFEQNSKELFKPKFESNLLVGFVRNKYSWHSIPQITVPNNYIRRSININFFR